jgi:hypothetical protein
MGGNGSSNRCLDIYRMDICKMKTVTCIKCGRKGRLNEFHPSKSNTTQYVIVHEGLGYGWGTTKKKSEKVEARRRCYLIKPPHRKWAQERLGEL